VSGLPVETQPERTGLAWQRTGLGVLAVAGLIGHGAFVGDAPALLVLGGAVALPGLGLLVVAPLRYRHLLRTAAADAAAATPRLAVVAVGTVVLAALAAGVAVLTYS
jgi:putative membrane protein